MNVYRVTMETGYSNVVVAMSFDDAVEYMADEVHGGSTRVESVQFLGPANLSVGAIRHLEERCAHAQPQTTQGEAKAPEAQA